MATVQTVSAVQVPAQNRALRAATAPPSDYARPWRSSPLAGPAFSTLPPIFAGSSEESLPSPQPVREFAQSNSHSSSSIASQGSLSASPCGSTNPSGLLLDESEASTSSVSPAPSTSADGATSSSHGYSSSQSHSRHPARLSKSWARRKFMAAAQENGNASPKSVTEAFVTSIPRARTVSHGHARPASFPIVPVAATTTMPPVYTRTSQLHPESNDAKHPPSTSRDPTSNWVSSSPFGPAMTPRFSRLAMASPAVVMPLSAKEYRKRKARESVGRGKDKEPSTSSNHVTFADASSLATLNTPDGVPLVTVSPPSESVDQLPTPSGDARSERHTLPPQQHENPPPKQQSHATLSAPSLPRSSSPNYPRSRSRPNTPPRSSPLATQPPISPKSSTGTFYSLPPASDDETARPQDDPNVTNNFPPARPRPRPRRRKSFPDRVSNGARLSFIEAMNRLSQGSVPSQTDDKHGNDDTNRLSTVSQASGRTLFYDVVDAVGPVGEERQVPNSPRVSLKKCSSATQSLENLSSTRMGGESAYDSSDEARRAAKRNVRMVRISDTVEVSPSPVQRRRKLTKSRPVSVRGGTILSQSNERRVSLLPWKSKRGQESKGDVETAAGTADKCESGNKVMHAREATTPELGPAINTFPPSKSQSDHTLCESPTLATPAPDRSVDFRKNRRSTFGFLSAPSFRPKREREKSNTVDSAKAGSKQPFLTHVSKEIAKTLEAGTGSTSTSIHTMAQTSQTTLVPASGSAAPPVYDLTTLASSDGSPELDTGSSAVPMMRRLNAQTAGAPDEPLPNPWESNGSSTPSLVTMGSTVTSSSTPRTLTASSFVPRPSALKASFTDTEEDRVHLRVSAYSRCPGAHTGSRPGSASSTGTETSGSYVSLSTVPASSTSASGSGFTSRSDSPVLVVERRDRVGVPKEGEGCSMCGHFEGRTTSPPPTYVSSMHPMFTVPLVTVPPTGYVVVRGETKGVPHDLVVPVYGHGPEVDRDQDLVGGQECASVLPVRARTVTVGDRLDMSSSVSPAKVRKQRRPQTAPGGTGDVTRKGGTSRLKTVLKGLIKWSG